MTHADLTQKLSLMLNDPGMGMTVKGLDPFGDILALHIRQPSQRVATEHPCDFSVVPQRNALLQVADFGRAEEQ